ncbi:hypothetical protein EMIT0P176_50306 [Pseudomonas sp. IT-P176]
MSSPWTTPPPSLPQVLQPRAITAIDVHHRPNEILLKILTRNIGSIPTKTPRSTLS